MSRYINAFIALFISVSLLQSATETLLFAGALDGEVNLNAASRLQGVGAASVPLLTQVAGPGNEAISSRLLTNIGLSDGVPLKSIASEIKLRGSAWKLIVANDGTYARFRRQFPLDSTGPAQGINAADLDQMGRLVIKTVLADMLQLGTGEQLVATKTKYEVLGGQVPSSKVPDADHVVSNAIVFGRVLNGVSFIGSGSRVAIIFRNSGELSGFDVDWPLLAPTTETQETLSATDIWTRAGDLLSKKINSDDSANRRFECGYFDPGARRRSSSVIQSACVLHRVDVLPTSEAAVNHAFITVIPAGRTPVSDSAWPETARICSDGSVCNPPSAPASRNPPAGILTE